MKVLFSLILVAMTGLIGCANFQRSPESGYANSNADAIRKQYGRTRSADDGVTETTAYELGKDPSSLSAGDLQDIDSRHRVRELERTLSSRKEKEQYSKVLPWFKNDDEKIAFLSISTLEGRQQWLNSHNIWERSRAPKPEMKELVDSQDIAVGMPADYVRRSWGDPTSVEVSGNPIYKNERWKYQRMGSSPQGYRPETRYVYFEGGRVVGWETQ
jgi:hypothetical protein